jgi:hypothetical protein
MASALPPSFRSALSPWRRPASALHAGVSKGVAGLLPGVPGKQDSPELIEWAAFLTTTAKLNPVRPGEIPPEEEIDAWT